MDREKKYKAKNFIDTVVYRGGDASSGWFYAVCISSGIGLSGTAWVGASMAGICAVLGFLLGKKHESI